MVLPQEAALSPTNSSISWSITVTSPSIDTLNLTATSIPLVPFSTDDADKASRKKFKCTMCTRAFDRAFNLKTHMETHNPNRVKAYVCTHGSCGRAFSRKHDLGRHVTSIHRNADATDKAIGVGKGAKRCDNCGGGSDCDCAEAGAEREHRKVQVE
ncbi:hypothetical protein BT96DRAFT_840586 [Gymnopus androsaceus JB14]|uniref:C2H2-type domain-containing protein n=1 Tax=Gymnopus androsaceus JB14 TaxID=1447944 RepID=A0A6A4GJ33_9AGAR|nr:hypothetical protein BT96DRAFT_840586 [Gymnopus androsaceus JB14]